jgi:alkylation response protein AidB-like acyl-CoA dehydrogenase
MNAKTHSEVRAAPGPEAPQCEPSISPGFKLEVKAFLDKALTPDLQAAARATTGLKSSREACALWQQRLLARGWLAPAWPVEYGGAGWSAEQRIYFETICAEYDAPLLQSSGIRTIGPLIIAAGTPAQKAHYLPAILSGAHEWCQGFSEPQAGSDLSAMSMRARLEGEQFVLNGSKIWTSFAQNATHMFLLARSDPASGGNHGLVFLLVEMDQPGISVRPIRFIDGEYETNEVFFDNVRTPAADRIGEIGNGWRAARQLMTIARSNNTTTGLLRRAARAARRGGEALAPGSALSDLQRQTLSRMDLLIETFEATETRMAAPDHAIGAARSSALKLLATERHQLITETGLDTAPHSPFAQAKYFATRAATIYSGTSEVHRNILARAIGCP